MTLGELFHQAPKLQDSDLLNITLLTFADINGQLYSVTPIQLKFILENINIDEIGILNKELL